MRRILRKQKRTCQNGYTRRTKKKYELALTVELALEEIIRIQD
jgi:hypothetical protein